MKTPLTIGQFFAFLVFVLPTSIFWVINAEKQHDQIQYNENEISEIKQSLRIKSESDEKNFDLIIEKLHNIELGLKDKKDR